jgi:predicted MFS family arabinose efflux permease
MGLLVGGGFAYWLGEHIDFRAYKRTISICYVLHGATYIIFSQMRIFYLALLFIALSRAAVAVSSVLNMSQLLRHVSNEYRGRVFATMESMVNSVMMVSMALAGIASQYYSPRIIAATAGALSSTTAFFWAWANMTGRLPEPPVEGVERREVEVHGEPTI